MSINTTSRTERKDMDKPERTTDKSAWAIGGMTLTGLGVGFVFLHLSVFFFIASIIVGIGLGILIAAIISTYKG
jgi:hypothetical protein